MEYLDILRLQMDKFFYEILMPPIIINKYVLNNYEYDINEVVAYAYSKKVDFIKECFALMGDVDDVYGTEACTEASAAERFKYDKESIEIIVNTIFSEFNGFLAESLKPTAQA